jgi:alkylation response protein AidB-like acyl-CoA dehydrogenase
METATFRRELVAWLDAHADALKRRYEGHGTLDEQMEQFCRVKRLLFDAGWGRYGWSEEVGGLGGPSMLRAIVGEEIAWRDLAEPGMWSMIEVLAPTVIKFASRDVTQAMVPPLLRGDETWCQGFSEPGAGSDLASLTCRATPSEGGWVVNGQKVWTSYVQFADRCVLLTRTGEPGSAHRGITALLVDVDSPGITHRPLQIQNGRLEFAEVFFDDVFVPASRQLGEVGQGWSVAMDILPYERSTAFWHRGAHLLHRCEQLVVQVTESDDRDGDETASALGEAYQNVFAFRCRSRATQHRLAAGEPLGAETSVDKIMVATAEQILFQAVRDLLPGEVEFEDTPEAEVWRAEYLYARAATIYGGTSEVQRNIVARRLLDLGDEP